MPSDMNLIVEDTILAEGGVLTWTNRRGDRGGETVGGVSRVHWPNEPWWSAVDAIRPLNDWPPDYTVDLAESRGAYDGEVDRIEEGVLAFYHRQGWIYKRLVHVTDVESQEVAGKLFDLLINGGRGLLKPCVKALQAHLGVSADGVCGPGTLAAVNAYVGPPNDLAGSAIANRLVSVLAWRQMEYYINIVKRKPDQIVNLKGWKNRAAKGLV